MLTVRGHHLLCMLAFSGEGYSESFTHRFREMAAAYALGDTPVTVVETPDDACAACPHSGPGGCNSAADGPEVAVRCLDRTVIVLLGLTPGVWSSRQLHRRIAGLTQSQLHSLCADCSWYGRLDCQELIARRAAELAS